MDQKQNSLYKKKENKIKSNFWNQKNLVNFE